MPQRSGEILGYISVRVKPKRDEVPSDRSVSQVAVKRLPIRALAVIIPGVAFDQ